MGPAKARIPLKNSTTLKTFPISVTGTSPMIIDLITVVVVESRNPIPDPRYNIHLYFTKTIIIVLIKQVNASENKNCLKNKKTYFANFLLHRLIYLSKISNY